MPTLQLPSVIVKDPILIQQILLVKAAVEMENRKAISMAELVRLAMLELAKSKNV